jgi:hypothetical protein
MSAVDDFMTQVTASVAVQINSTALVTGTNFFKGYVPTLPNDAVLIVHHPTPGPVRKMGSGTAGIVHHNAVFQVTARSLTHGAAVACMQALVDKMDNFVGTINGHTYLWVTMRSGPVDFGQDENKRFRISATFQMQGSVL